MIVPVTKGEGVPAAVHEALCDPRLGGLAHSLWTVVEHLQKSAGGLSRAQYRRLAPNLIYCLQDDLGDGFLIPLNRAYKPIAETTTEWIEYEAKRYSHLRVDREVVDLSPLKLIENNNFPPAWFFFDGSNPPWRNRACLIDYWDALCTVCGLVQPNGDSTDA